MATDKTGTWSLGESVLWYSPTSGLDASWSLGESAFLDEYVAAGGLSIPVAVHHYKQQGIQ
jgi:hypothetical protein